MRHEAFVQGFKLKLFNEENFRADYRQYEGKKVELIVREWKKKRSLEQNAFYWGHVLKMICEHTGYDKDDLHALMKERFNPKPITDFDGKERIIGRTTTKLSVAEMTQYLEDVMRFGVEELEVTFEPIETWVSEHEI